VVSIVRPRRTGGAAIRAAEEMRNIAAKLRAIVRIMKIGPRLTHMEGQTRRETLPETWKWLRRDRPQAEMRHERVEVSRSVSHGLVIIHNVVGATVAHSY
jgi:hypothetical protein